MAIGGGGGATGGAGIGIILVPQAASNRAKPKLADAAPFIKVLISDFSLNERGLLFCESLENTGAVVIVSIKEPRYSAIKFCNH